jgi:cation diffusion facilitator CzcD-associated flavoprotein CzcO
MGPRVVIIGAGFGGLGAARELLRQGVSDLTILERADEVGGVWRDNTYPGAACDVPSPLYSWSWAVNPAWGRRYSRQPEILGYLRGAADLHEQWADGARAHLGVAAPGFPNLFFVYGPNTNLGGSSIIGMMEAQAGYVAQVARRLADTGARRVEVRADVADVYDREMQARLGDSVWSTCTSWYRDGSRITTNWPGKVAEYQERTAHVDWSELQVS